MLKTRILHPALFLLFISVQVFAQQAGLPFIRNFPSEEYRANQQNWDAVQDHRGVIYFGNNDGIIEYDGVSWRLIKLPGVRSLAVDSTGRIYVGLENDLGYLEPDRTGNWQFISLREKIPAIERDITTVFTVFVLGEQVLFQDQFRIYRYLDGEIKVFRSEGGIHRAFGVRDSYFVREQGRGLWILQNDSLRWIEGSEPFATDRIYAMLPIRTERDFNRFPCPRYCDLFTRSP